jgi:hypothetical protein
MTMVRDAYMHWRSTDKGLHGYLSFGLSYLCLDHVDTPLP